MLYASTRAALSKALGSAHFVDAIFATSKADLTPTAYAAHRASASAPLPLSQAEREMADIREAERQASSGSGATGSYSGIRARKNHVGPIGFAWAPEAEEAVKGLSKGQGNRLVVLVGFLVVFPACIPTERFPTLGSLGCRSSDGKPHAEVLNLNICGPNWL